MKNSLIIYKYINELFAKNTYIKDIIEETIIEEEEKDGNIKASFRYLYI